MSGPGFTITSMAKSERSSSEWGWLVVSRAEYDKLKRHGYAGREENGSAWILSRDEDGATCLYRGVTVE